MKEPLPIIPYICVHRRRHKAKVAGQSLAESKNTMEHDNVDYIYSNYEHSAHCSFIQQQESCDFKNMGYMNGIEGI